MALTIEDGTGIANADAWADYPAYVAWHMSYYGTTPDDAQSAVEAASRRAVQYIGTLSLTGSRTYGRSQGTCLPRKGMVDCDGGDIAQDEIPVEFIMAQHELTRAEIASPGILTPQAGAAIVKREKIDTLEVEYDTSRLDGSSDDSRTTVTAAIDKISCFLASEPGQGYFFSAMVV